MSKKHYVIIVLLVLAALAASLMLLPKQREIALMQVKDKHFEEAQVLYEQQLSQGNLTIEVANQLTQLYLQTGDIDKAIEVMEKFIASHPNHLDARKKLGTFYQYAQRQDDYLRNLEEINRQNPQPENLKLLSDIYNFNTQYDKQAETLKKLIEAEQGKDPQHFKDLANILATNRDSASAISTLQRLQQGHPDQFDAKDAALLISLLLDEKRAEEATQTADAWIKQHLTNTDGAAQIINIVHYKGNEASAQTLLDNFTAEQINASPDLLEEYILIEIAEGKDDDAYARLKNLHKDGKLSTDLQERMLFLAVYQNDQETVTTLLKEIDLSALNEGQLLSLLELGQVQQNNRVLSTLNERFPVSTYESYPLLAAGLAIASHSKEKDAALAKLAAMPLTPPQTLQMGRLCAQEKYYDCTKTMLARLSDTASLNDADIAGIGELYIATKQWETGADFIAKAQSTRTSPLIDAVAIKFAAARGDTDAVTAWLNSNANASARMLNDLFYVAYNNGHANTALVVAEFAHNASDTPQSRSLLANAYIAGGKYADAVALLRAQTPRSQDDENNYLTALARLSPRDAAYRQELASYAAARLRSPISAEEKLALIYALVNAKQIEVALPAVRELALKEGGQWAALYADTLDKQGKHEEARTFWLTVARQPSTPLKQKREIAYTLLNQGYKDDAEQIFAAAAANAPADNDAVKELLYVWGPRPNESQMEWVENRYDHANASNKAGWADIIADYASSDRIIGFVERHPDAMKHTKIATAYFEALAEEGSLALKGEDYIAQARSTNDANILRSYAQVAQDNGYRQQAARAYAAIASMEPNNAMALREAGIAAYGQSSYSDSERYLRDYANTYKRDIVADDQAWSAFFHYAELLRRQNKLDAAKEYYHTTIEHIGNQELATPEALSAKAQSEVWLGDIDGGLKSFASARALYPQNDSLRADLAAMLVDLKRYEEARALLATPPDAAYDSASMTVKLPAGQHIKHYTLLSKDSELLITSTKPLGGKDSLSADSFRNIDWISSVSEGYDTLLVTAKPGYRFQITSADGKTPDVNAVTDTTSVAMRDAKQTVLRYELLSARIDLETGHIHEATKRLNNLLPEYPNDAQLLGFTANAENYGGNWPRAEQLLKDAHALAPENEDIADLERNLRRAYAPGVQADYDWIRRGNDREHIVTLSGYVDATGHIQTGALMQSNRAEARGGRLADGRVGNFKGWRERGEIYARYHDENGQVAQASLFANNDTLGVGGYYSFLNLLGQTGLTVEWHRPFWEYTEAVLDDATRDRIALLHTIKPTDRLTISAGPTLNRYNVSVTNNVLTTAGGEFEIVYRLIDAQPFLAIGYGIDAEYDLSHKKRIDANGDYTRLFPQEAREIHFVSLTGGYQFTDSTYGELMMGYGYDRLGGHGPIAEGKLTHEFNKQFDAQIRALYGLDTGSSNSNDTLSRVGGYVRWRF